MEATPDVNNPAGVKQPSEGQGALSGDIVHHGTSRVQGVVEDGVKVATQNGRNLGVDLGNKLIKKEITRGVAIGCVCTKDTETRILEGELGEEVSTSVVKQGTNKVNSGPEKHNTAT